MVAMSAELVRKRRMARIRYLSRLMARGCSATSVLLIVAMPIYWAEIPTRTLLGQAGAQNTPVAEIDILTRTLALGISMIPLGVLVYGLLNARRCFAAFAAGRIFCREPIAQLKTFSVAVAASALLTPFANAALSIVLSWNNPPGSRTLSVGIGSDTLIALVFAGMVAIVAWVMAEAIEISDENKQFV